MTKNHVWTKEDIALVKELVQDIHSAVKEKMITLVSAATSEDQLDKLSKINKKITSDLFSSLHNTK
jgi:hypothetical protein